jgi:hypothetical protein
MRQDFHGIFIFERGSFLIDRQQLVLKRAETAEKVERQATLHGREM